MSSLVPVDVSLIRQLRLEKRFDEADALLKAFHEQGRKNKHELKLELDRREYLKKNSLGVCVARGCGVPALAGMSCCDVHRVMNNSRYQKKVVR